MPLKGTKKQMFHEFRHGGTFKRTAAKSGKAKAEKQMQAAVLSTRRRKAAKKAARKRKAK
jgi:hypothetical protein